MKTYLIDGAKNTFALVSFLNGKVDGYKALNKNELASMAHKICIHPDVEVDGCVFVFPNQEMDFSWEFFNSDGSEASMCGNAARAVSYWYYSEVKNKKHVNFKTPTQNLSAEILESDDELKIGAVKVWLKSAKFIAEDHGYKIYDSGVPHLCVYLDNPDINDESFDFVRSTFKTEAKSLRFPKVLDEKGSNVTYFWKSRRKSPRHNGHELCAVSFERGVEDWTEACGTGAIAAAYYANDNLGVKFPIYVQMPGGVLTIDESESRTSLSGPAQIFKVVDVLI